MKQRIPKYRYHWTEDGPECAFPFTVISFFGMGKDMEIQVKTGDGPHDTAEYGLDGGALCQFTGLYDKNGKEIYEGDVVRVYDPVMFPHQQINPVEWMSSGFWMKDGGEGAWWALSEYMEVIGNIHENPELIDA